MPRCDVTGSYVFVASKAHQWSYSMWHVMHGSSNRLMNGMVSTYYQGRDHGGVLELGALNPYLPPDHPKMHQNLQIWTSYFKHYLSPKPPDSHGERLGHPSQVLSSHPIGLTPTIKPMTSPAYYVTVNFVTTPDFVKYPYCRICIWIGVC